MDNDSSELFRPGNCKEKNTGRVSWQHPKGIDSRTNRRICDTGLATFPSTISRNCVSLLNEGRLAAKLQALSMNWLKFEKKSIKTPQRKKKVN
jgi:hypothetical protein